MLPAAPLSDPVTLRRAAGSADRVDGRTLVTRRDRVANIIGAFWRTEGLDVRRSPVRNQEVAVGLLSHNRRSGALRWTTLRFGPARRRTKSPISYCSAATAVTGLRGKVARQHCQGDGRRARGGEEITALMPASCVGRQSHRTKGSNCRPAGNRLFQGARGASATNVAGNREAEAIIKRLDAPHAIGAGAAAHAAALPRVSARSDRVVPLTGISMHFLAARFPIG